ncbi:hypothetical protein [Microbulbifer sp.]|uniref:hypothetical protein n=1 Tax=Microbulbifer sp. TaxID=1908541 RepID=UPI0025845E77|nr:hypothetical protein [Microbulbifer sp.]
MAVNRSCSLLLAGLLGIFAGNALAQSASSLSAEQSKLARMEQSLENRLVDLEDAENEVLAYDYKLKRAEESLSEARAKLEQSRRELMTAEREHKAAPSSDTERALHKARHGFNMAERGVDSRVRRVEIIQSTHDELQASLDKSKAAVAGNRERLDAQQALVEKLVSAMLVEAGPGKKAAVAAGNVKSTEPAVAIKAPAPVGKPDMPAPTVAALEPVEAPEEATEEVVQKREIDPDMLDYVLGERERLQKLLAELEGDDTGKHTFRHLTLTTRTDSGTMTKEFEFLGDNQYRLIAPVSGGRQTYKINSWKFRRTIPWDDEGERYVFILDARRLSRPRLVMYPEYVLSHLDQ